MINLSPIVVFAFNRPYELKSMLMSLKRNALYEQSNLIFFIDGPRNDKDKVLIDEVIKIARNHSNDVRISDTNRGLGPSIIRGVTDVIEEYGKAIVLEDDLFLAKGFIRYMNDALNLYENDKRILSVCGYGLKLKRPTGYLGDVFLSNRSSSWGWATWRDRWEKVDWNVGDFYELKNNGSFRKAFNKGGSDMFSMLDGYMTGRNESWAIRFCYHQFKYGLFAVHPFKSLVANEGFGKNATNCKQKYSRYKIEFDDTDLKLKLDVNIQPQEIILKEMASYNSIPKRIYSRIRKFLNV